MTVQWQWTSKVATHLLKMATPPLPQPREMDWESLLSHLFQDPLVAMDHCLRQVLHEPLTVPAAASEERGEFGDLADFSAIDQGQAPGPTIAVAKRQRRDTPSVAPQTFHAERETAARPAALDTDRQAPFHIIPPSHHATPPAPPTPSTTVNPVSHGGPNTTSHTLSSQDHRPIFEPSRPEHHSMAFTRPEPMIDAYTPVEVEIHKPADVAFRPAFSEGGRPTLDHASLQLTARYRQTGDAEATSLDSENPTEPSVMPSLPVWPIADENLPPPLADYDHHGAARAGATIADDRAASTLRDSLNKRSAGPASKLYRDPSKLTSLLQSHRRADATAISDDSPDVDSAVSTTANTTVVGPRTEEMPVISIDKQSLTPRLPHGEALLDEFIECLDIAMLRVYGTPGG